MSNRQSMVLILFLVALASLRCASTALAADHWPQFRGPAGDGHTDADGLPVTWSETKNIAWKTPIHGRGWSSPVVWGEQVWMTTATEDGHEMFAVCVALDSGEVLHDVKVFTNGEIVQEMGPTNSYASPTPVIEEGRVYVHFGVYGTACLDTTSGKVLWQRRDIHCDHFVGPGSSPILCGDLMIFHMDGTDVQFVVALDKQTGRTVWKTARSVDFTGIPGDFRKAFSTPLVVETGGTRQLISTGAQGSYAYDPTTGEELWRVRHRGFSNVSRPLFGHGLVYVNSAYPRASLIAVRSDGRGDVTDSHVVWEINKGVAVKPSPVMVGDWIFAVNDKGIATCLEATTGELIWQQRLGGQYSASPIHGHGRIYFFSQDNKATVIEAAVEYKELAVNELDTGFMASPAVVDKALILRTETHLYRVEESGDPRPENEHTELRIGVGPPRPNIVYFFVDDMGWQDTSVPFHTEVTPLNKRYYTPNMAKLAAQGMKFTQAYACAVCSPSRVSLMTGLNAARHGVTNWTLRKNVSPDRKHPKIQPPAWNLNGLSAEPGVERTVHAVTLPMLLRSAGYRTIHAGKAHFGARGTPGENPLNLGFDVNIAGHAAGGPGSYQGKNNFSAAFRRGDRIWDVPGLEQYHGKDVYLNEALTIEANKAVDQAVADGKPFYLYMSHYAVHAPWEQDDRFLEKYTEMGLKGLPAVFASMIESMDKSLGDIVANLDRLGVADRTIVVFMTDNGCPSNLPRNLPLRGHKITPYEGGTRVPLIVKWPNVVKPETTCNDYLIIEDIFPTFLEMAGVAKFEQIGGAIDGVSFMPLLKQKPPADPERPIFWHFPNTYGEPPYSSVRKGDWKLIYHHADRRLELYNLNKDIGEKQNLAAGEPEKLREMADTLTDFLRKVEARMPVDKTTGKSVEYPSEVLPGAPPK